MGKKEVFTRIDEELYWNIKKKGYKISELIKLGYEYKEKRDKVLTEESIRNFLEELKKISNEIKENTLIFKVYKEKVEEIINYVRRAKSRIASKIFPSKYDMINVLEEIEKMLNGLIK